MRIATIRPPRLRTKEEGKRTATWLELFYDLVFVVGVAVLGGRLVADTSWTGIWSYVAYFTLLWWLWASHTFYADRYDTDDLLYRLLATGQIIALVLVAASLSLGESASNVAFAVGYTLARGVLLALYARAYKYVPETRPLVKGYLIGFGIGAGLWAISIPTPAPWQYALWATGFAIELATPWIMRREQARVPLDVSHLPERFGLFTILVLGESIAAVVSGLTHVGWGFPSTVTALLGVGVAAGLWWMYFDNVEGIVVRRRDADGRNWRPTTWIYSHLPLAIGVAMVGVGLDHAVIGAAHGSWPASERWALVAGMAVAFGSLALIHAATAHPTNRKVHVAIARNRLIAAPLALAAGLLAGIAIPWLVGILFLITAVEVATDMRTWALLGPPGTD